MRQYPFYGRMVLQFTAMDMPMTILELTLPFNPEWDIEKANLQLWNPSTYTHTLPFCHDLSLQELDQTQNEVLLSY